MTELAGEYGRRHGRLIFPQYNPYQPRLSTSSASYACHIVITITRQGVRVSSTSIRSGGNF